MCRDVVVEPFGLKHDMVERLAVVQKEKFSDPSLLFDGKQKLPTSTKEIAKMPICFLQSVLAHHSLPACGTKDDLILRVTLIANKRKYLCFNRE